MSIPYLTPVSKVIGRVLSAAEELFQKRVKFVAAELDAHEVFHVSLGGIADLRQKHDDLRKTQNT